MRNISSEAESKLGSEQFTVFLLLGIVIDEVIYRFTNCDIPLVYDDIRHEPYPFEIDNISISSDHFSDSLQIKFANLNDIESLVYAFRTGSPQEETVVIDLLIILNEPSETNLISRCTGLERVITRYNGTIWECFKFNSGNVTNITHLILRMKKQYGLSDDDYVRVYLVNDDSGYPGSEILKYSSSVYGSSISTEFQEVQFKDLDYTLVQNTNYWILIWKYSVHEQEQRLNQYLSNYVPYLFWNDSYWPCKFNQFSELDVVLDVDNYQSGYYYKPLVGYINIYPWFKILNANQFEPEIVNLFDGIIGKWECDEEELVFQVVGKLCKWSRKTLNRHPANCRWQIFKGIECKYNGNELSCDRSYIKCQGLNNTANFGGFRWLPDLEKKEIWWGKSK